MARTDTLPHFLTDVADAIRTKGGTSETIQASSFDTAISAIPSADPSIYFDTELQGYSSSGMNLKDYVANKFIENMNFEINCSSLSSLESMFNSYPYLLYCDNAPILKNTNNVSSMKSTFYGCTGPTTIDASKMNTANVRDFQNMFSGCTGLTNLDLSSFTARENYNLWLQKMFYNCSSLQSIDLKNFGGENALFKTTSSMFQGCSSLTHLDLRSMHFENIVEGAITNMFTSVPANCEIIVKDNTQKQWMNTNFSSLTNVKTVAEYENE